MIPQSKLIATMGALTGLMLLTIFAAQVPYWFPAFAWLKDQHLLMNLIAIGIAFWKAWLVVSIFMGVKFATKLTRLFAIGGFVWFTLMFITMIDYFTRPWEPVKGWEAGNSSALPRNVARPE